MILSGDLYQEYLKKCKEVEFLNNQIKELTKEHNKFRSQSIMRMNKIKELEGILNGNGEGN